MSELINTDGEWTALQKWIETERQDKRSRILFTNSVLLLTMWWTFG